MPTLRRIVIPIRNRNTPFFEATALSLQGVLVDEMTDVDFGALFRDQEEIFRPILTPKAQCLSAEVKEGQDIEATIHEITAKIQFVFKALATHPPILSHGALILSDAAATKAKVDKVYFLPAFGDQKNHSETPCNFHEKTSLDAVVKLYEVITKAVALHEPFLITLSRFNSSWLRGHEHDRIIDIAISLESLLSSSTEISFKFSLYNAFISTTNSTQRAKAFELFKLLYSVRSSIVHGDIKSKGTVKNIAKLFQAFPEILDLAKEAILYYAFYLNLSKPELWPQHIENIVLGTEAKLNQTQPVAPNASAPHESKKN